MLRTFPYDDEFNTGKIGKEGDRKTVFAAVACPMTRANEPRIRFCRYVEIKSRGEIFFLSTRDGNRGTYRDITTPSMCVGASMNVTDHRALAAAIVRVTPLSSRYVRSLNVRGVKSQLKLEARDSAMRDE